MNTELPVRAQDSEQVSGPAVLPLELLKQVAGGLPYHGFKTPVGGANAAANEPATDLPYHGF